MRVFAFHLRLLPRKLLRKPNLNNLFIARHVFDGSIKMFAYLVSLNDPNPFPLLAVEEPENQLYPFAGLSQCAHAG